MPYVTDDDSKAVQRITEIAATAARDKSGVGPLAGDGRHADAAPGNWPRGSGRERP